MGRRAAWLALPLLLVGCVPKNQTRAPYYGPTLSLTDVVEQVNYRNAAIPSLWASGSFKAHLVDPQTKKAEDPPSGDLTLLYRPEKSLRAVGKVITQVAFDIGANDDRYWMVLPTQDMMWWGYQRLIGNGKASQLPIRPDLIPQVLAVTPLEPDLLKEPAPTLRFNNDQDCYMLTWNVQMRSENPAQVEAAVQNDPEVQRYSAEVNELEAQYQKDGRDTKPNPINGGGPLDAARFHLHWVETNVRKRIQNQLNHWAVQKEVWYDRQTLNPRLVLLFDANGRIVLRSYLSKFKPIDGAKSGAGKPIEMASQFDMFFPDSGSTFSITLDEIDTSHNNAPNDRSFAFPGDRAGVSHTVQIDE